MKKRKRYSSSSETSSSVDTSERKRKRKLKKDKVKHKKKSKDISSDEDDGYYFDKIDARRHVADLLRLSGGSTKEMMMIFKNLDKGNSVAIDKLHDKNVRKKVRHLFQALCLDESGGGTSGGRHFSKPKHVDISLLKLYIRMTKQEKKSIREAFDIQREKLVEIANEMACQVVDDRNSDDCSNNVVYDDVERSDIIIGRNTDSKFAQYKKQAAQASNDLAQVVEYGPLPNINDKEDTELDNDSGGRQQWMMKPPKWLEAGFADEDTAPKPVDPIQIQREERRQREFEEQIAEYDKAYGRDKSLLQMTKDGQFEDTPSRLKQYMQQRMTESLWGKSASEQDNLSKGLSGDSGQPWKRFNRETDLGGGRQVTSGDFDKLVQRSQEMSGRFSKPKFENSFS